MHCTSALWPETRETPRPQSEKVTLYLAPSVQSLTKWLHLGRIQNTLLFTLPLGSVLRLVSPGRCARARTGRGTTWARSRGGAWRLWITPTRSSASSAYRAPRHARSAAVRPGPATPDKAPWFSCVVSMSSCVIAHARATAAHGTIQPLSAACHGPNRRTV